MSDFTPSWKTKTGENLSLTQTLVSDDESTYLYFSDG